jgi:phosphoribosyl 1,2-cyclic phosphodiesterase
MWLALATAADQLAAAMGGWIGCRRRCADKRLTNLPCRSLILIDCGPTFYGTATLAAFAANGLRRITALLLTHAHADAILGLDSLRAWTMGGAIQQQVDVYCTQACYAGVAAMFPYLVDRGKATGSGSVGALRFHIIDERPFAIEALDGGTLRDGDGKELLVTPLPVQHGFDGAHPFPALGFRIGPLSYLSDLHHAPASTAALMRGSQLLVLDALSPYRHPSHFSLSQACSMALSLPGAPEEQPRLALLTDLTHRLNHQHTDAGLQRFTRDLRAWRIARGPTEDEAQKSPPRKNGKRHSRGEGGEPRWWAGAWDERASEGRKDGLPCLEPAAATLVAQQDAELNGAMAGLMAQQRGVPDIRVAWDGLVVPFDGE